DSPELSPLILPPPRARRLTCGQSGEFAACRYAAAVSTRATAIRRSALYATASLTSASSCRSLNVASQFAATGAVVVGAPVHCAGGTTFRSPSCPRSVYGGGSLTARAARLVEIMS